MYLKKLINRHKTIGFKLSLWYTVFFVLSVSLLFLLAYMFLSQILKRDDHQAIESQLSEVVDEYATGGLSQLKNELVMSKQYRQKSPFFFRFASPENNTTYILYPRRWSEFKLSQIESFYPKEGGWITIPTRGEQNSYSLEISSSRLPDGSWLQVGLSTESRQRILNRFLETFIKVAVFLLILGVVSGYILSRRALLPIRDLIQTVRSIDLGQMDARVPRTETQDELGELVRLFNQMLAKIESLIEGMKDSLDNVAHELRTPMTRMHNIAEVTLRSGGDIKDFRQAFENFVEESNRILKMLSTLMDISEAENGVMSLDYQEFSIKDMILPVIEVYDYVAEEKGFHIQSEIKEDFTIKADFNRISQVLANLIDNAIKYTPQDGSDINVQAWKEGSQAVISVSDQGQGIAEQELPKIWDRLYRAIDKSGDAPKGLGLGLAQVKAILQAHNGWIEVYSKPELGSVFKFYLPQY